MRYIVVRQKSEEEHREIANLPTRRAKLDHLTRKNQELADEIKKAHPGAEVKRVLALAVFIDLPDGEADRLAKDIARVFGCHVASDQPIKLID